MQEDLDVETMGKGFFFFRFNCFEDSQRVLEEGPWFIDGHPLALKSWSEDLPHQKEQLESIPIWVKFPNLTMSFRSANGLSRIAGSLGRPICMDRGTTEGRRPAFAKVLVEVYLYSMS